MIRIAKPAVAPAILAKGAALVTAHETAIAADPSAGGSKKNPFKFKKTIYGPKTVKTALQKAQHEKCCFCEGRFLAHASGDVEHFRPKTCYQQTAGGSMMYPGYWWLAYDWSNLYFACENCNRSGKKNLFPLRDPTTRAASAGDNVTDEDALLIDPGLIDPRNHIRFRGDIPYGTTELGRATIGILKLDRGKLTEARRQHLKLIDALMTVADWNKADLDAEELARVQAAEASLRAAVAPDALYSSMTIDYLA